VARLWADGLSCSQIAREIGDRFGRPLSRNAVIGVVHRAGLAGRSAVPRKIIRETGGGATHASG
jgi:hypothetical protein